MKCILHIGMPKTGTTSLQFTLHKNRDDLARNGVLYPKLSAMKHAHHLLMPFFIAPNHCWGRVKGYLGRDEAALLSGARREWETIRLQIDIVSPETLVLSTEAFFVPISETRMNAFRDMIRDVAQSVSIVAYVRHPSDYYRSILLERAKRTTIPRPPDPISYRRPIEQFETAFDVKAKVRGFRRQDLLEGDINTDFFHRELGLVPKNVSREGNRSLSPEAMEIYQGVMEAKTGLQDWSMGDRQAKLLQVLKDIETGMDVKGTSTFKAGIAGRIAEATTETSWLRARYGIDFTAPEAVGSDAPLDIRSLRDAFEINEDYRNALVSELISREALSPHVAGRLPGTALPSESQT